MKLKKTLALLLSLMMVISLVAPAWATDLDSTNEGNQVEIEPDDESSVDEVQPDEELNGAENANTPAQHEDPVDDEQEEVVVENVYVASVSEEAAYQAIPVAKIGDTPYETLAAALNAAQAGDEIILQCNYELPATILINKDITLNLNAKTLTCEASSESKKRIEIASGANVTLCGVVSGYSYGTITNSVSLSDIAPGYEPGAAIIKNEGTLTLSKIYIQSDDTCIWAKGGTLNVTSSATIISKFGNAIATNGTYGGNYDSSTAVVNITGGTIESTNAVAVYVPAGTFNISGGNITGATAVYMKGGTLNISGSKMTGNGSATAYTFYGSGAVPTGDALVIDVCGYPYGNSPAISVTGGSFRSTNANAVGSYAKDANYTAKTSFLSGGEYTSDPSAYVAQGFASYASEDGYEVVAETNAVAEIGGVEYASLADAVAAVPTNGTETVITMTSDSVESNKITVAAGQNIVLNLAGHTVSYTSEDISVYFITVNGTLTIQDTTTEGNGTIQMTAKPDNSYSKENVTVYNNGGVLNLQSGIVKNCTNGGLSYAINNSSNAWGTTVESTFNMTGGTVTAPNGDAALRIYQNTGINWKVYSTNHVNISGGTILDTGIFVDTVLYTQDQDATGFTASDISRGCVIDTEINISGGTINGLIDLKIRHPFHTVLNITGGDFTNSKLWVRKVAGEYGKELAAGTIAEPTDPMVNISGGTFTFLENKAFGLAYDCGNTSWTSYTKPYNVTGGSFNVDPSAFVDTKTSDVTGPQNGMFIVEPHTVHVYDYSNPAIVWRNVSGRMSAIFTYSCVCGETETEIVLASYYDAFGERIYSATDSHGNPAQTSKTLNYTVTLDGAPQPKTYEWGEICTLTSNNVVKAWYIDSISEANKVADGTATYTFAVTGNTNIVTDDTTLEEQVAAVSAKLTSTESGKATFNAKWSLPEGSTISSVKIYRGSSSADKVVAESTLTSKGSVHNVNLFVRNGDYTLNLTGLTPGKWQHALIQIKYNDKNGNPQTLTSTVQKVQVHS